METGHSLKVSPNRLVKLGIEPATPGLQGKRFIHYTIAAPSRLGDIENATICLHHLSNTLPILQKQPEYESISILK